jgi:DNA-binding LytR/AlgR family response regulator
MIKPLKIAICEDIQEEAEALEQQLKRLEPHAEIDVFQEGTAFLSSEWRGQYDVIFLDIFMPELTGVDVAEKIRKHDVYVTIVFITNSTSHALEGYRLNVRKYLMKPCSDEDLISVLEIVRRERDLRPYLNIRLNWGWDNVHVMFDEILFIQEISPYCYIHTTKDVLQVNRFTKMKDLEKLLPYPPFLRCHHSYIVNFQFVEAADNDFFMKDGSVVYIRGKDRSVVSKMYSEWLRAEMEKD